jgi:hypothetical protein
MMIPGIIWICCLVHCTLYHHHNPPPPPHHHHDHHHFIIIIIIIPSGSYTFRLSASSAGAGGGAGLADLVVRTASRPLSGGVRATPTAGDALLDRFRVQGEPIVLRHS